MSNYRKHILPGPNGAVETDYIIRVADGAVIPPDEMNSDWQTYQAWLEDGNTPDEGNLETFGIPAEP